MTKICKKQIATICKTQIATICRRQVDKISKKQLVKACKWKLDVDPRWDDDAYDSQNFFPWHQGIITNLVKLIRREQVERWTSTYHGVRAPEVHCYATPIYNLGKCRLTDEFLSAFATLILLNSHFWVSMTFPLMYELPM